VLGSQGSTFLPCHTSGPSRGLSLPSSEQRSKALLLTRRPSSAKKDRNDLNEYARQPNGISFFLHQCAGSGFLSSWNRRRARLSNPLPGGIIPVSSSYGEFVFFPYRNSQHSGPPPQTIHAGCIRSEPPRSSFSTRPSNNNRISIGTPSYANDQRGNSQIHGLFISTHIRPFCHLIRIYPSYHTR
jgi:hypothetical protein